MTYEEHLRELSDAELFASGARLRRLGLKPPATPAVAHVREGQRRGLIPKPEQLPPVKVTVVDHGRPASRSAPLPRVLPA
jgi:hypothetical protein